MFDQENNRTKSEIASLLSEAMPKSSREREELARQVGYEKPNVLTMLANGDAKVPLEKVPALAAALGIDARRLLRLAVRQFFPASSPLADLLTENIASENEMVLIKAVRAACGTADPAFTPEQVQGCSTLCVWHDPDRSPAGDA